MMNSILPVALVMCVVLLAPGFLTFRAFGMPRTWAAVCAPLASLSLIAIMGEAMALVGVPSSAPLVAAVLLVPTGAAALVAHGRVPSLSLGRIEPWVPLVYLVIGAALGYNLFLTRLGSPDALFQAYDVTQHLNLIQSMADSGRLSSLGTNFYLSAADAAIDPINSSGFYPAAWHSLCALVVMITGASVPLVINVSMYVFACLAYPLAVLALVGVLFPGRRGMQLCGALVSLAFVAFPWNLLAFGPIYANVAGFALMPVAMALFVHLLADDLSVSERVRTLVTLLGCVVGMALCHPNTVFTCVAALTPYCVSRICSACGSKGWGIARKLALSALFCLFVAAFWLLCFNLPALQETVRHFWKPHSWLFQQLVNTLTLIYNYGFNSEIAAQLVLGALVVIGFVKALNTPGRRWLAASYAVVCYIVLIGATHEDEYRQILAGFWYTDPMRLAAIAAICATPLATMGIKWVYDLAVRLVSAYNAPRKRPARTPVIAGAVGALFLLLNFMPELSLPGLHHVYTLEEQTKYENVEFRDWPKSVHTTYGDYREVVEDVYSYKSPLSVQEQQVLDEVKELVPDGALIVNNPMDGSFLAYGADGLRLYYRNFIGVGSASETEDSRYIRLRLCFYDSDPRVREAVEAVDAQYVLVMQDGEFNSAFINLRGDYNDADFAGITSITDDTPGFSVVKRQAGLVLYKIER